MMKAFTSILATPMLSSTGGGGAEAKRAASCSSIACDACSPTGEAPGVGLWGIFPRASPSPAAACLTSYTPSESSVGCPCTFNANTINPAIIGYKPDVAIPPGHPTTGLVQAIWTANVRTTGGQLDVNVYSGWDTGDSGFLPLLGSLSLGITEPLNESYVIFTPADLMTLTAKATIAANSSSTVTPLFIELGGTYGTESLTFSASILSPTSVNTQRVTTQFSLAAPVSEWWYRQGLKVPYDS